MSAANSHIEPALVLEVDLAALVANWRDLACRSKPARASAVVKGNGYGLGLQPVIEVLYAAGCRDFFVATVSEGMAARHHAPEARIYVLNGVYPGIEHAIRSADLVPVLSSTAQVALWSADCTLNGPHPCALQVDTGMHRLGLSQEEAIALAQDETRPVSLTPVLVISHLACADRPADPMNERQRALFQEVTAAFEGIESSLCNSAGIFLGGNYLLDMTRPGIALYGGEARGDAENPMRCVATAKARILQLHRAAAGETVSYGAAERLERDTLIATCAVGYADGYPRGHSGAGVPVRTADCPPPAGWLAGQRVAVLGRVTMDLTMFDVTDIAGVKVGDFVELFGPNHPLDDVARAAGTIGYEILATLGGRYHRIYSGA